MRPLIAASAVLAASLSAAAAGATGADPTTAEVLFREGSALWQAGRPDDACERFAKSQEADPAVGTLFFLSDCALRQGKVATAWYRLREAAALAARKGDTSRQATADERSRKLEPSLPRLRIHSVEQPPPPGLAVRRDDVEGDAISLDVPIPVDPGEHRVGVKAPGRVPWETRTVVPEGPGTTVVEVPRLAPAPRPARPAEAHPAQRRSIVPAVASGACLLGLGVGVAFGALAQSAWSDIERACPGRVCPDAATRDALEGKRDAAASRAGVATAAFVFAGVAAAVAIVAYVLDRPAPTTNVRAASLSF